MNGMDAWADQLIVGVLVVASAAFAGYRLGPARMRLWLRRQWARARGKPLPAAGTGAGGCGDCPHAMPPGGKPTRR
jgi:hypothetical protein